MLIEFLVGGFVGLFGGGFLGYTYGKSVQEKAQAEIDKVEKYMSTKYPPETPPQA